MSAGLRLAGYTRRYAGLLLLSVVLMAIMGAMTAARTLLIKPMFSRVLRPSFDGTPEPIFTIPLIRYQIFLENIFPAWIHNIFTIVAISVIVVFLVRGVCDYLGDYLTNYVGFRVVTDLRNQVFAKLLRHGAAFFESNSTGRVMSSVMSDIEKIQTACSDMFADLLRQTFSLIGLLIVIFGTDWRLALFALVLLPFVILPAAKLGSRIRKTARRTQDATGDMNELLQEAISGHQVVKAFGAEKYEATRFRKAADRLLKVNMRKVLLQGIPSPFIEMAGAFTFVWLLWYGRVEIQRGILQPADFMSFLAAILFLYEPFKRLTNLHNIFQQAIGASEKVFSYLDQPEEIVSRPKARILTGLRQGISFDHVTFRYPTAESMQLDNVSLDIPVGEIVALVGSSGAGKSTLVSLLPRFRDPVAGAVRIDGVDVRDLTVASLRENISLVAQDTFLFNDTVAANIAYGAAKLDRTRMIEAAKAALAHDFIELLPQGYETVVGERGTMLSGGQRQRLAIARAIFRNSPILILDEATSHLDTESERLVQQALSNLMVGRTVIVIAHRISTVRRANRIVALDRGRIVEVGTHDELMQLGGTYYRLHEMQFADTVVDL